MEIYDQFDAFRGALRQAGRAADEDAVMDTMDRVVGYCAPSAALFPRYLTNEKIEAHRQQRFF